MKYYHFSYSVGKHKEWRDGEDSFYLMIKESISDYLPLLAVEDIRKKYPLSEVSLIAFSEISKNDFERVQKLGVYHVLDVMNSIDEERGEMNG